MTKLAWKPWHQVVQLRPDLRTGELSLAMFAADLYEVLLGRGPSVYRDPKEFFTLTYPTYNLRELAKDVALRLAGKNDKAVRQLELTYGGGKTHTLIALYHLFHEGTKLPDLPAVQEFREHMGIVPPKARVAALTFDKLDVEKGMEVRGPSGEKRVLRHPWSVLAFQLAGADGLRLLNAENKDEERESAPAENLLIELLEIPAKTGHATLVLIDEVLMYAREKVALDPVWRIKLSNFFQYLTQAAVKVSTCAMVASLLATDPRKSDTLGREIAQEFYNIFRREKEEGVQPVVKEDVAEILRRRFFTPDSIRDPDAFKPHVVAALKGVADLDEHTRKDAKAAEERFLKSYPFHPDLTEVLYSKWTNLEGFQRTRGVLRTFALALREAEKWDESPLIGPNVFLTPPEKAGVSEAARELTSVASMEEFEGKKPDWTAIVNTELDKARAVQETAPSLHSRELEQAVLATFLHSQPVGQKALTRELLVLLGPTRPDRIDLEKALMAWSDVSWFLDEREIAAAARPGEPRQLPKAWRLGPEPNLHRMHHDARQKIGAEAVEARLLEEIRKVKTLIAGANAAGVQPHLLPERPKDVDDDGEFHYAVLGPKAASDPGKPSAEAARFLSETTSADRPRIHRNAVVLVVPSRDALEVARDRVKDHMAWLDVQAQLKDQQVDITRRTLVKMNEEDARKRVPEALQQAYCIVVTVSEKNDVIAFRVTVGTDPLFGTVKADKQSRMHDAPINADAILPGGPYDLWREGETSRRVRDLASAFSQFSHLPKMLRHKSVVDTLVLGAKQGVFVLRLTRADRSIRTFWREEPSEEERKDPSLEVVLPQAAELARIPPDLLQPGQLPELWEGEQIVLHRVHEYFAGGHPVQVKGEGYAETVMIPKAPHQVVEEAIREAVHEGTLWLLVGGASLCGEDVPPGLLTEDAMIQGPPAPVAPTELLPSNLPEVWADHETTPAALASALSKKAGRALPWRTVRVAIDHALRARLLQTAIGFTWTGDFGQANSAKLRVPAGPPPPPPSNVRVAKGTLRASQFQELADRLGEISKIAADDNLKLGVQIEVGGAKAPAAETISKVNKVLKDIDPNLELKPES